MPRSSGADHQPLVGALREAWNRKLCQWWRYYNDDYLGGALKQPLITLSDAETALGRWQPERRRISISVSHVECDPWLEVMETLRHEMAHQYVSEVLREDGERPHGEAFRQACHKLRCSPRASAVGAADPHNAAAGADDGTDPRILRLIKKTLSLATSPNEHEAQVAVDKARDLLLRYNVDLVELDRARRFGVRRLGPVKGRRASYELWLALLLQDFFFVEVLWVFDYDAARDKSGTVLQVHGTATNLEMAEYTYTYLVELLERLWRQYRRARALESNRERQRYYAGVLEGFHRKLQQQERAAVRTAGPATAALVWRGDSRLREYFSYLNPRVRTRRGRGVTASEAHGHGLAAGQQVNVHRPLGGGGGFGGYLEEAVGA